MNEKQLLEGLNYIDDDLLAESVNVAAKPNKVLRFPFKRLVVIAACLCLIIAIAVPAGFALGIFRGNYKPHNDGYHLIRQDIDNTYYIELLSRLALRRKMSCKFALVCISSAPFSVGVGRSSVSSAGF